MKLIWLFSIFFVEIKWGLWGFRWEKQQKCKEVILWSEKKIFFCLWFRALFYLARISFFNENISRHFKCYIRMQMFYGYCIFRYTLWLAMTWIHNNFFLSFLYTLMSFFIQVFICQIRLSLISLFFRRFLSFFIISICLCIFLLTTLNAGVSERIFGGNQLKFNLSFKNLSSKNTRWPQKFSCALNTTPFSNFTFKLYP